MALWGVVIQACSLTKHSPRRTTHFMLWDKGASHPERGPGLRQELPKFGHLGLDSRFCHFASRMTLGLAVPPGYPSAKWGRYLHSPEDIGRIE